MKHFPSRQPARRIPALPCTRKTLWTVRPYPGRLGLYLGVTYEAGELYVGVRIAQFLRWVPAAEALSSMEAEIWASSGFKRN
jgi:hypothetical protein